MSSKAFTFVCLLVHHGVWNQQDHDVFKSLIATCKRIYQYVHTNKPLVQKIFNNLVVFIFERYATSPNTLTMKINNKNEGVHYAWWVDDDAISVKRLYHNNKKHGKCCMYFRSGQLHAKMFYQNNVVEGEYIEWYANGQLAIKVCYENGRLHGSYLKWTQSGELSCQKFYQNGHLACNNEKIII